MLDRHSPATRPTIDRYSMDASTEISTVSRPTYRPLPSIEARYKTQDPFLLDLFSLLAIIVAPFNDMPTLNVKTQLMICVILKAVLSHAHDCISHNSLERRPTQGHPPEYFGKISVRIEGPLKILKVFA